MKAHLQPVIFALLLLVWIAGGAAAADNALKYKLKPGTQDKLCSGCHPDFEGKLKSTHVHTPVKKGECTGCHNPHTSTHGKLLASDRTKICATCHSTVFSPSDKSIHRVVQEGGCVKCHDPHGSPNPGNLLKEGNELCFSCHKEMGETVAKVRFKHPPVAKGCLTCHDPHSSPKNGYLLKSSVPGLYFVGPGVTMHTFSREIHVLEASNDRQESQAKARTEDVRQRVEGYFEKRDRLLGRQTHRTVEALNVQTSDGYAVTCDVTLLYSIVDPVRIAKDFGWGSLYVDSFAVNTFRNGVLQTIGKMNAEAFYNEELRIAAVKDAESTLRTRFAERGFHVESRSYGGGVLI